MEAGAPNSCKDISGGRSAEADKLIAHSHPIQWQDMLPVKSDEMNRETAATPARVTARESAEITPQKGHLRRALKFLFSIERFAVTSPTFKQDK